MSGKRESGGKITFNRKNTFNLLTYICLNDN